MYQTSIRKKKKNFNVNKNSNYEINFDCEEYGLVKKMLGNCRVSLLCNNGQEVVGVIRGTMRKFNKRVLIEKGDIVVISKRDYQNNKVDIVHKITPDQHSAILESEHFSNILKNEYHNNSYLNDGIVKDFTHINFNNSDNESSDSDKEENAIINELKMANIKKKSYNDIYYNSDSSDSSDSNDSNDSRDGNDSSNSDNDDSGNK